MFRPGRALLAACLASWAAAAAGFPETLTTTSRSGQFVVTGPRVPGTEPPREYRPDAGPRSLTPQTLAIACERIKAEVLDRLELPDLWRNGGGRTGRIVMVIDPRHPANRAATVEAGVFENGWQFRAVVPSSLTEDRLVRVVVQALLMEVSNRGGNQRIADLPLWLVEGLTQTVMKDCVEGALPTPHTRTALDLRRPEALEAVRDRLSRSPPLEFHQLGQPDLASMSDRDWGRFSACAQLCLFELWRLPDGPARIRQWVLASQQYWNWQTGFIESFQPIFRSLLDVEKWWALSLANFTGRDASQAWPAEFALRKLDEALQPIGLLPSAFRTPRRLTLEEVITTWDFNRQVPVLRRLLQQLQAIRLNAPADLRPLVVRYLDFVDDYLTARGRVGASTTLRGQAVLTAKVVNREAVGRLRTLDEERRRWTPDQSPAPGTSAPNPPTTTSPSTASIPTGRPP